MRDRPAVVAEWRTGTSQNTALTTAIEAETSRKSAPVPSSERTWAARFSPENKGVTRLANRCDSRATT
jgi:hypothetical protein